MLPPRCWWQAGSSKAIIVVVGTTNCFCLPRSFISHIPLSAHTPDQTNKKQPLFEKKYSMMFDKSGENVSLRRRCQARQQQSNSSCSGDH